jgi:hypothetical protein
VSLGCSGDAARKAYDRALTHRRCTLPSRLPA